MIWLLFICTDSRAIWLFKFVIFRQEVGDARCRFNFRWLMRITTHSMPIWLRMFAYVEQYVDDDNEKCSFSGRTKVTRKTEKRFSHFPHIESDFHVSHVVSCEFIFPTQAVPSNSILSFPLFLPKKRKNWRIAEGPNGWKRSECVWFDSFVSNAPDTHTFANIDMGCCDDRTWMQRHVKFVSLSI